MEKLLLKDLLGEASNIKMQNGKLVAGASDSDQLIILKVAKRAFIKIGQDLEFQIDSLNLERRSILKDIAIMDNVDQEKIDKAVNRFVVLGYELTILERKSESYKKELSTFDMEDK